jgi:hypothetical protein
VPTLKLITVGIGWHTLNRQYSVSKASAIAKKPANFHNQKKAKSSKYIKV